jgi:hypothetical protein
VTVLTFSGVILKNFARKPSVSFTVSFAKSDILPDFIKYWAPKRTSKLIRSDLVLTPVETAPKDPFHPLSAKLFKTDGFLTAKLTGLFTARSPHCIPQTLLIEVFLGPQRVEYSLIYRRIGHQTVVM